MVEVVSHVVLLGVGAFVCFDADQSQPVAFLLLPLLMWAAARFPQRWANLELLGVARSGSPCSPRSSEGRS